VTGRLRAAFSIRRNVHDLFVRAPGHLEPLDGLRALSIVWVALFHAAFYSIRYLPFDVYVHLLATPTMLPIWRGDFGVDVFFVLSGFLVAKIVIDERTKTGGVRLGLFQLRRFLRTWPALAVALFFDLLIFWDNADVAWLNLVYLTNFVTVAHICMGWTWSLSLEEQFYMLCPWILRGVWPLRTRGRVLAIAAIGFALSLVAAYVVLRKGYHPVDTEIVVNRPIYRWIPAFDDLYTKPWMRAAPLLAGIGACVLHCDKDFMSRVARSGKKGSFAFALAIALAALSTHWQIAHRAPRWFEVTYLVGYRPTFGVGVATVMLFSISEHPLGKAVGRALGHKLLYPIGQLAYSAYLVNPIATTFVDHSFFAWVSRHKLPWLWIYVPFDLVTTFAAAFLLHVLVERPLLRLRPRAGHPTKHLLPDPPLS
jgi:peptidoglycan/LPS O-acetylase OafA/YrhL